MEPKNRINHDKMPIGALCLINKILINFEVKSCTHYLYDEYFKVQPRNDILPTLQHQMVDFNWIPHQFMFLATKKNLIMSKKLTVIDVHLHPLRAPSQQSHQAEVHEWIFCKVLNLYGPATVYDWIKMVNIPSEAMLESYFNAFSNLSMC